MGHIDSALHRDIPFERARPLLGTIVAIRVRHHDEGYAHACINSAFEEIAHIHKLMSFHESESDVSRLNRHAIEAPVSINEHTYFVLEEALAMSKASEGCFDISIGAQMVEQGHLPQPINSQKPVQTSSWQDIELCGNGHVRFHKPLWIDLGGIAKGYAVDQAIKILGEAGIEQACVNAGGDLRVMGLRAEHIHLRTGNIRGNDCPTVSIADGSLASSGSLDPGFSSPHIDPATKKSLRGFVAVAAKTCLVADALTKIVLVRRAAAETVLLHYRAQAYLLEDSGQWIMLGAQV